VHGAGCWSWCRGHVRWLPCRGVTVATSWPPWRAAERSCSCGRERRETPTTKATGASRVSGCDLAGGHNGRRVAGPWTAGWSDPLAAVHMGPLVDQRRSRRGHLQHSAHRGLCRSYLHGRCRRPGDHRPSGRGPIVLPAGYHGYRSGFGCAGAPGGAARGDRRGRTRPGGNSRGAGGKRSHDAGRSGTGDAPRRALSGYASAGRPGIAEGGATDSFASQRQLRPCAPCSLTGGDGRAAAGAFLERWTGGIDTISGRWTAC
jgi:hypothetical protein